MKGNKLLDEKIAKKSINEYVDLDEYDSIEIKAATILAAEDSNLELNGIKFLDVPSAKALAAHVGENTLSMNGLNELDFVIAKELSAHNGSLNLNGIRNLSDDAMKEIVSCKFDLSLNGIEELIDPSFLENRNAYIGLAGLKKITPTIAKILVRCNKGKCISLDNIKSLTCDIVDELTKHNHDLTLNGVENTNPQIIESLSTILGSVWMQGLTLLNSKDVINAIEDAQLNTIRKNKFYLNGMQVLSEIKGAKNLGTCFHQNPLINCPSCTKNMYGENGIKVNVEAMGEAIGWAYSNYTIELPDIDLPKLSDANKKNLEIFKNFIIKEWGEDITGNEKYSFSNNYFIVKENADVWYFKKTSKGFKLDENFEEPTRDYSIYAIDFDNVDIEVLDSDLDWTEDEEVIDYDVKFDCHNCGQKFKTRINGNALPTPPAILNTNLPSNFAIFLDNYLNLNQKIAAGSYEISFMVVSTCNGFKHRGAPDEITINDLSIDDIVKEINSDNIEFYKDKIVYYLDMKLI